MKDLNKIILIGRLGTHPVRRETKNGTAVAHFSLATSRRLPDDAPGGLEGERKEETVWHDVVVWGRQAEVCSQYLQKGHKVYVEGSVRKHPYTAKDGSLRMSFEVHAESVGFLEGVAGERTRSSEIEASASIVAG